MNTIHLVGNVGQNPVLRETNGGTPVANVTLATNRVYRDREGERQQTTEWHRLVVWGEGARNFAEIVRSGDKVAVRGRLEYKLREIAGEKVKDAVIRVEEWHQLTRKAQPDALAGDVEDLAEAVPLESEIEGGTAGGDELPAAVGPTATDLAEATATEATGPEPGESTATPEPAAPAAPTLELPAPSGEEIPTEAAPEEDTPITRARRRKK